MLRALPALVACALLGACATLKVPSPSELDASLPPPAGLVTSGSPLVVPSPRFPLHGSYATQLTGTVTRLQPSHQVWAVTANATSEIAKGPDGSLSWKVVSMDAKATLDGKPQPLADDAKRALLQDYRLDKTALDAPKRALAPGESWSSENPVVRLGGDGTKTTGKQSETVTFLGTLNAGERTLGVIEADVRSTTRTEALDGTPLLAIASHAVRQLHFDLETGTVEVEAVHRREFARSGQGATETDGTVRHDRKP
ncbi:MAG: hypothetical protein AMXMBFR64_29620 [Myxococcales bacterium]